MRWMAAVLLLIAPGAGDDPIDATAVERARHQGTWAVVSMVREGKAAPADIVATITRHVDGDHVTWKREGKPFAGTTVILDPTVDPKTIDVTPDGGPDRDKPVLGIYKLDGDSLTICMAGVNRPRPKDFSAAEGSKQTLTTFRRTAGPVRKAPP